jgi:hypothetical protein
MINFFCYTLVDGFVPSNWHLLDQRSAGVSPVQACSMLKNEQRARNSKYNNNRYN